MKDCMTSFRTGELIGAKWQEFDFENSFKFWQWHIPAERMNHA
jgi:integrase